MSSPRVVVRNVLQKNKAILLGRRTDTRRWELPGGRVDDEEVVVAAKREQFEETGMVLQGDPRFLGFIDGRGERSGLRTVDILLLWADWEGEAVPDKDEGAHEVWQWFTMNDLPSGVWLTGNCAKAMDLLRV